MAQIILFPQLKTDELSARLKRDEAAKWHSLLTFSFVVATCGVIWGAVAYLVF